MSKIVDVKAREILDSRGNPTIEADVILENGERGSAAADKAALLAFTDIMVQVHRERVQGTHVDAMSIYWPLSWRRTTAPCDRHVDEKRLGWAGVMCDAVDGRVVYLSFSDAGPAPACQDAHALNIGYLQPLARLETLDMGQCQSVVGDVEWLARLTELRFLNRWYWIPPAILGIACFLVAGWSGLLIGFFLSTVLTYHSTFCIGMHNFNGCSV